ncbi:MAG: sigma 54-interacting transcriptional regulator [Desulfobacterales bacterium]|nr:sigma 54-interacting transcriptional regulator [Desulfobacterales bacterium]
MNTTTSKMGGPSVYEPMAAPPIDPANLNQRNPFKKIRTGVYVIQKGCFRYADERLAEILGYATPKALIGHSFWQRVYPDDRARVCLVKGQAPFRCIKDNGAALWVLMNGVNTLYDNKPANVGCLINLGVDQGGGEPVQKIRTKSKGKFPLWLGGERPGLIDDLCEVAGERTLFNGARSETILTTANDAIIGRSDAMREVCHLVQNLADLEATVLVTGERGTGKELIAKSLHFCGRRATKPFMRVNCSALAKGLLERELFGCAEGAFAGAIQATCGRVQEAEGGTLVLDDIGEISPALQLKLLRIIQEKEFERIGESISRKVDVRIVACTKKDLRRKVKSGEFREDLYYQLKSVEIALPPLRERLQDVPLLVEHFRKLFDSRFNSTTESISGEVLDRLMAYHWPWNVTELENAIERAIRLCHGRVIAIEHLPPEIRTLDQSPGRAAIIPIHTSEGAQDLLEALSRTFWNRTKAADLLGVSRQTLYRKIRAYKIFEMM